MWVLISQGCEFSQVKEVNAKHGMKTKREGSEGNGKLGEEKRGRRRRKSGIYAGFSLQPPLSLMSVSHSILDVIKHTGDSITLKILGYASNLQLCRMGCGSQGRDEGTPHRSLALKYGCRVLLL